MSCNFLRVRVLKVCTFRVGTFGRLSDAKIFMLNVSRFIPLPLLEFIHNHMPGLGLDLAKKNRAIAHTFAREMISEKATAAALGKGSHDVMSILGKRLLSALH